MKNRVVWLTVLSLTGFFCICTDAVLADLIGYWPFEEGQGTETSDISGNGNDGTFNGAVEWVPGYNGSAVRFDTAGERIVIGPLDPTAGTEAMTLAIWINWEGQSHSIEHQGIFGKRLGWDPPDAIKWFLEVVPVGDLRFRAGGSQALSWGNGHIASYPNEWIHVALTWDNGTAVVYINGEEVETGNIAFRDTADDTPVTIGCTGSSNNETFVGSLDEARIYNHALSAEEIQTIMIGEFPTAFSPGPADGAMHEGAWVTFSWKPGTSAASHDVYLGDNFDDVNEGTGDTFRGNETTTFYVAGFSGYAYPEGLVPGTTYYWRIDEVNDADPDSPWKGDVWSFTVTPRKAYNPNPVDGAKFLDPDVDLSWTAGFNTIIHNVYLGDNFADVEAGTADTSKGPAGTPSFSLGTLEPGKTYYWRIDENDGTDTHKGDVWSFTVAGAGGGVRADYYTGMNFENLVLTRTDPQINFNWGDPGGPDPAVGDDNFSVRWTGEVEAAFTETYTFYARTDDGVRLWVDGQLLVENWIDRAPAENKGMIDLIAGNTYSLVMEYYENGSGAVAELRWSSLRTPKQFIPQAALALPVKASSPTPRSGSVDVRQTTDLSWGPGDSAASHELYFGTDEEAVRNATKAPPEYKGAKALGDEYYDLPKLDWETTYYWRVDEINTGNPDSPWVGNVWNFTTAGFMIVDDFEDYDIGNNEIWFAWNDGLGAGALGSPDYVPSNGTGSMVGDDTTGSYTEETIVHGDTQSMPYWYDNNKQGYSNYSEAKLTLTEPRDWTEGDVSQLTLWFRGFPGSVGSFVEGPAGTYTFTVSGWFNAADVEADEFHFAYKLLTGTGSIVAKVESIQNTHTWAKAGVMIRETLAPESAHAMAVITAAEGVAFQRRPATGDVSVGETVTGISAPQWVKIERTISGSFTAYYSSNGTTWLPLGTPQNIQMSANVYIGLALTSHDAALTCEAVFSNVTTSASVSGQWTNQDIGIASNAAEPLYVAVSNSAGQPAVVVHNNPNAAQIDTWTKWFIPLQDLTDQGINLTNVDKIAIGLGTKGNTMIPGGSGKMFFDDIRLERAIPVVVSLDPDHVVVPKTSVAPIIDGQWDGVWNDINETRCLITDMINTDSATPEDSNDLSATFKAFYDDNNFYIFVEVQDSVIDYEFSDYRGDGVEIYFDGDNSHGDTYDGVNDNQIRITVDDVVLADIDSSLPVDGAVFKILLTDLGYNIEASFPLEALQIYPSEDPAPLLDADGVEIPNSGIAPNNLIGFEVQINDNDSTGGRQTLMRWHSDNNDSWDNPSLFGQARLVSTTVGN